MLDLYFAPTPNGWKISIMLEECGLAYNVKPVNIGTGEQFAPDFLKISPNNRIPALVDHAPKSGEGPLSIFETGAILLYLAEKTGQFLPTDPGGRYGVIQWLMWQMGGLGPMLGQHGHFALYAPEKIPYAIDRYRRETERLYGVLDRQLADNEHVAGADYSIADMACFPWVQTYKRQGIDLAGNFPNVRRWYDALKERPELRRGMALGREALNRNPQEDAEARKHLFGLKD
ncbi:glutathione binding-like protein [Alterisphingorhabdus coralli]|uniref:Glutathione binding-like protein n=1 Tax=Alterisphingorhabdus coralli TaxID=3071408 RepID=A0AA97F927_9SPHN|nr:glutathione binding-like protein [Parasphingorhabdus sp. SCSIO 66989]WOE76644.1 glutathione binding-like protein [Parasphingorhabdus sp. SCSIO 66989]